MIILPLVFVLAIVAIVYATRHRHAHAMATGAAQSSTHQTAAISLVGRWSLAVLAGALLVWTFTFASLPIYFAAAIAGLAFVLAVVAMLRYHDRSPLLLLPLVFVPLSAALSAAFVLLS